MLWKVGRKPKIGYGYAYAVWTQLATDGVCAEKRIKFCGYMLIYEAIQ